jgi:phage shock protein E
MVKYLIGALLGGIAGYLVLHRLIGCSSGGCPITANPYLSAIYGVILGLILAGGITLQGAAADPVESSQPWANGYSRITAKQAKSRIDSGDAVVVLDVRTPQEYKAGHIPNAVLLPNETITDSPPKELPQFDAEILIYCRSGNRSAQAANKLIAMGYTDVYDFGGINEWPYDTIKEE